MACGRCKRLGEGAYGVGPGVFAHARADSGNAELCVSVLAIQIGIPLLNLAVDKREMTARAEFGERGKKVT